MSQVMIMPIPRFVPNSVTKKESDDAILSFIKDELDYDLLAEYFLEDGAFDTVGGSDSASVTTPESELTCEVLDPTHTSRGDAIKLAPPSRALESMIPIANSSGRKVSVKNSQLTTFNPLSSVAQLKRKRVHKVQSAAPPLTALVLSLDDSTASRNMRPKSQVQIERRRERNKILARRTRLRKKFFFESLQKEVCDLQAENLALKALVRLHLDSDSSTRILDESKAAEKLSDAVLEHCGLATNLDKQDFNLVQSLKNAQKCFIITDPSLQDNPIVYASDSFSELSGFSKDDVLGRNCRFLQGPETDASKIAKVRAAIKMGEDICVTMINYRADGTPFWNNLFVAALRDAENNVVNYIGVLVQVHGPEAGDSEYGKSLPEINM